MDYTACTVVEQDKIEKTFKNYIKMIYLFKLDFDKYYLKGVIMKNKSIVQIMLTIR